MNVKLNASAKAWDKEGDMLVDAAHTGASSCSFMSWCCLAAYSVAPQEALVQPLLLVQ